VAPAPNPSTPTNALAVDLDGTLTLTDTLHESVLLLIKKNVLFVFVLPLWLFLGKAAFKAKLAQHVDLDPALLPYNMPFLEWLAQQKGEGRKLILSTAADQRVAQAVADHIGLFDRVFASNGQVNHAGLNKVEQLDRSFGKQSWDYAGNSASDLPVWKAAHRAIVVNARSSTLQQAKPLQISQVFAGSQRGFGTWARALRLHQWIKNLLLLVPIVAAHQLDNSSAWQTLGLAFLAFSLCASGVYAANDLLDLTADRLHPRKRKRPFASGDLPVLQGVVLTPVLFAVSGLLALQVNSAFASCLVLYFVMTWTYTLVLKQIVLVDCLTLTSLYTLRILAGAAAVSVPLSFWLLAFSIFIFLSLAFVKRYAELLAQAEAGQTKAHGRGYQTPDAPLIQTLGVAAAYSSVLVLALYLQSDSVSRLYAHPELIWLSVPLMLFWVSWVWMNAHRGRMHDDPIVFAIKDRVSLLVALVIGVAFALASRGLVL
jgi:4-hydroxybenzoate polyprenyltransferase